MTLSQKVSLTKRQFPHKTDLSGVWKQYDGGLISWSPWWKPNEPSGGKAENCAVVDLSEDKYAGQWADLPCSAATHFICEIGF